MSPSHRPMTKGHSCMRPAGRFILPLLAVVLVLAGSGMWVGHATAARTPTTPLPAPFAGARLVTLRNGMQLLLAPDTAATAVDVAVWSRAGSAREPVGRSGISRLFERLMFTSGGPEGRRDHGRRIAEAGGQAGSRTMSDLACYYETVPPAALEEVLELEAGRLRSLRPTAADIAEAARAAGDEARRQSASLPWGPALQAFYDLAWGTHPYHRLAIGADADLSRIGPADCEAWHAAAFAPGELVTTITGRFDPAEALAAARRWLEPIPRRPGPAAMAAVPAQTAPRRGWERLDVPLGLVVVGWKVPGHAAADMPALRLLARLFGADPESQPQRALLADSVGCLSVQAMLDARREEGLLYVLAALKPGADSARVERVLLEQLESFAREPVSEEELARARRMEEMGTVLGWQTARGCADALGTAQILDGDWRTAALRHEAARRRTAVDVQRAAARALVPAGRSLLWVTSSRPAAPATPSFREGR